MNFKQLARLLLKGIMLNVLQEWPELSSNLETFREDSTLQDKSRISLYLEILLLFAKI